MNNNPAPHDKRLHFGCGLLFGAVITFLLLITSVAAMETRQWMIVGAGALIGGLLAARHGEPFWAKASSIIADASQWLRH